MLAKENLSAATMITGSTNQTDNSILEKYCYNDDAANCTTYGGLYQWSEAMRYSTTPGSKGICPAGWHIPTYAEFLTLEASVESDGNALKAIGQGTDAGAGTNASGFSVLLSGYRHINNDFGNLGTNAHVWSSSQYGTAGATNLRLSSTAATLYFDNDDKDFGYSIRCLKDETPLPPSLSLPEDGAKEVSLSPTLIWHESAGSTSYTLHLSSDSLFSYYLTNQSGLADTTLVINGLTNSTKYFWHVHAVSGQTLSAPSDSRVFTTTPGVFSCNSTVTHAGKTSGTVRIGGLCWFTENLNVGTMISGSTNQSDNGTFEKYCYQADTVNCRIYGGLYQWNEAMQYSTTPGAQGICPPGWRIPTYAELLTLKSAVDDDGNALKAIGQGSGAGTGTNSSGFSALLAGNITSGYSANLGVSTCFWSSTESGSNAYVIYLNSSSSTISPFTEYKEIGYSIRCVTD